MQRLIGTLRRAVKKRPSYIVERVWNELRMRSERYRAPRRIAKLTPEYLARAGGHGSVDAWWQRLGELDYPAFFGIAAAEYDALCAGDARRIISAADAACAHEVDLLGSGPVALGTRIDWHRDYK